MQIREIDLSDPSGWEARVAHCAGHGLHMPEIHLPDLGRGEHAAAGVRGDPARASPAQSRSSMPRVWSVGSGARSDPDPSHRARPSVIQACGRPFAMRCSTMRAKLGVSNASRSSPATDRGSPATKTWPVPHRAYHRVRARSRAGLRARPCGHAQDPPQEHPSCGAGRLELVEDSRSRACSNCGRFNSHLRRGQRKRPKVSPCATRAISAGCTSTSTGPGRGTLLFARLGGELVAALAWMPRPAVS